MKRFEELDLAARAPEDRPYLVINMVASVDGRATLHGRTKDLSSPADKEVFFALRRAVDAVLVGTGTLREERYGPILPGAETQPLAIVCSRTGDFPDDVPLLSDPELPVLRHVGDIGEGLRLARAEHGVRSVLCEGGPTLNGTLFGEGLVQELFESLSPQLAQEPPSPRLVAGGAPAVPLELVAHATSAGFVFLRYRVRG